jgi:hypothetical protein
MKNIIILVILTVTILSACNMPGAAVQLTEISTEQPIAVVSGIPVSFQNISFVIPEGMASGAASELIPAADETNSSPWGIAPEHTVFTLNDFSGHLEVYKAEIHIYPAQEYASVNSWANKSLTHLQAILASPAITLTNDNLPTVPFNGAAAQLYAAQAKLLDFNGGKGVRMISHYGQFPGHVTMDGSYYHYEGLTSDGKYMIAVMLPIILPLQSTANNPDADGVPYPSNISDTAGLAAYYQGITDKLNSFNPDSFQPSLTQFDALIQSITINSK